MSNLIHPFLIVSSSFFNIIRGRCSSPNARVLDTAIAFGGDVIRKKGVRVDGDAYSFGGKIEG